MGDTLKHKILDFKLQKSFCQSQFLHTTLTTKLHGYVAIGNIT